MREVKVLSVIRTDGGTQARAGLDEVKVAEYAERMEAGDEFPALKVMYDGSEYWLYDGFHRHAAAIRIDRHTFPVDVQSGTQRDARRKACSVNSAHGLPRTAEDKRRAVLVFLEDEEWATYSDRKIADELKVSPTFVGKIRASLTVHVDSEEPQERKYTTKHGTEAVMRTGNIGTAPRNLADGIKANVSDSAYESILSLQNAVLTYYKPFPPQDAITLLENLKADHRSSAWSGLSLHLGRNGKIFRVNDLRQAVNNALDSMRFTASQAVVSQPSEPAQETIDEQAAIDATLLRALNVWRDSGERWRELAKRGLTSDELKEEISRIWGLGGGSSGPGLVPYYRKGGADPKFWYNTFGPDGKPTLRGAALIGQARVVLQMPFPQPVSEPIAAAGGEHCLDCGKPMPGGGVCNECFATCVTDTPATVLNSEQTEPAPKPRIAPFVMGHFQVANEALARIYTAIPKSRTDDIHDFAALIATLERLERRIGAEYDMS